MKNWRPVTLLNLDYKILAKILANRICKSLPSIIHDDQSGFVKGSFIGCNIRKIEECIEYLDVNNMDRILVIIDFEKAFDSLNWDLIY